MKECPKKLSGGHALDFLRGNVPSGYELGIKWIMIKILAALFSSHMTVEESCNSLN